MWSHSGHIGLLLGGRFLGLLLLGRLGLHEVVLSGLIDLLFDGLLTLLRLGSDRLRCFLWPLTLRLLLELVIQVIADDGCNCKGNQRSQDGLQGIDPRTTLVQGILLGLLCGSHFAALILRTFTFYFFFRCTGSRSDAKLFTHIGRSCTIGNAYLQGTCFTVVFVAGQAEGKCGILDTVQAEIDEIREVICLYRLEYLFLPVSSLRRIVINCSFALIEPDHGIITFGGLGIVCRLVDNLDDRTCRI